MSERRRDLTEPVTLVGVTVAALVALVVATLPAPDTEGVAAPAKPPPTSALPPSATSSVPTTTTTTLPAGVRLATAVYDLRAGTFVSQSGDTTPFAAESLTKLLIATDLAASGRLTGDNLPKVQQMLATSDDNTANQLWTSQGSTQVVTRAIRSMGLQDTVAPRDPGRWGDTTTTAADVVKIYRYITTKMPAAQRKILLGDLTATAQAADGTDQDFGITAALPKGQWWAKQAWACCRPAWDVHTTGLVGTDQRYVVVALSQQPLAGGFAGATKVMTTVAKNLIAGLNLDTQP